MLNHHCVHRCFSLQSGSAPTLSTNSLPKDKSQRCCFLRAVPEYFNDPPAFFSAPKYVSHGPFFAVNCLILRMPILLAHLHPCSLLASTRHKCLLTALDCAAQRASDAPSPATRSSSTHSRRAAAPPPPQQQQQSPVPPQPSPPPEPPTPKQPPPSPPSPRKARRC